MAIKEMRAGIRGLREGMVVTAGLVERGDGEVA